MVSERYPKLTKRGHIRIFLIATVAWAGFWLAFYFTVPLAFYDWLYCGLYLGHGIEFIARSWYLAVYYAIPWVLLPLVALLLNRTRPDHSLRLDPPTADR